MKMLCLSKGSSGSFYWQYKLIPTCINVFKSIRLKLYKLTLIQTCKLPHFKQIMSFSKTVKKNEKNHRYLSLILTEIRLV